MSSSSRPAPLALTTTAVLLLVLGLGLAPGAPALARDTNGMVVLETDFGLRDGAVRELDLSHMTGIVSFPSYHAALPVILFWGLYPVTRLRVPAAIWAGLTIVATPLFGGHYGVDVLAGLLLAMLALAVARRLAAKAPDLSGMHWPGRPARPMPRTTGRIRWKQGAEVIH